jgi:tripartite-type tricarboxylate transporter receptor subunit TctC
MSPARYTISLVATALAITALSAAAHAQTYPAKPITVIIPFGAGGGTDNIARILQEDIRQELGQPIIIDNKPGANGAIGSAFAARAAPDGYELMLTASSTFSLNPNLMKNIKYDQLNDFVPVAFVVRAPWMMVVHGKSGFKSVADVVKAAKESPGKLTVGFWQSNVMITSEVFAQAAGVQFLKVPYKSVVEAVGDLLGERIDILFVDIQAVRAHVEAGKLRYLAATTANRVSVAPDVPTLVESGYPSVVVDASVVLFAPAKTPRPIIERLNAAMVKVVSGSAVAREKLKGFGHEPTTMTLPELDTFVRSELSRWGDMIKAVGLAKE